MVHYRIKRIVGQPWLSLGVSWIVDMRGIQWRIGSSIAANNVSHLGHYPEFCVKMLVFCVIWFSRYYCPGKQFFAHAQSCEVGIIKENHPSDIRIKFPSNPAIHHHLLVHILLGGILSPFE
jgi:hypothetical protein